MTQHQNKSPPAHTPLPWKPSDSGTGIWSAGEPLGKNKIICICSCDAVSRPKDENKANAAFITRACNSHYELLEALEAVLEDTQNGELLTYGQLWMARAAIAKARGQS